MVKDLMAHGIGFVQGTAKVGSVFRGIVVLHRQKLQFAVPAHHALHKVIHRQQEEKKQQKMVHQTGQIEKAAEHRQRRGL